MRRMVTLSRITTRTGDAGTTGLVDGSRVSKACPLIEAIGTVDEANSVLGLLSLENLTPEVHDELRRVQNDLFDLGSDLASPPGSPHEAHIPRITAAQVQRLEDAGQAANAGIAPLTSFILPGGTRAGALFHLLRTTVRRAERCAVRAQEADPTRAWNPEAVRYLNRLSDTAFIWSRLANDHGRADVLWRPGGNR